MNSAPSKVVLPFDETKESQKSHFRELALAYQHYAHQAGVSLTPFRDPALPLFSAQPPEMRQKILHALSIRVSICEQTVAQGHSVGNSPMLLWSALKKFGYRPTSDLFAHVTTDKVIEIHTAEGVQLFCNFHFFKFCSYSIEELFCDPWSELFDREPGSIQQVFQLVGAIFTGQVTSTILTGIPAHRVSEKRSPMRFELLINMKYAAPLYAEGTSRAAASIVLEDAHFLEEKRVGPPPLSQQAALL